MGTRKSLWASPAGILYGNCKLLRKSCALALNRKKLLVQRRLRVKSRVARLARAGGPARQENPSAKGVPGFLGSTCMSSLALALNRKKLVASRSLRVKSRVARLTRPSFAGTKLARAKSAGKEIRDHHRGDDRELPGVQPLAGLAGSTSVSAKRCWLELPHASVWGPSRRAARSPVGLLDRAS